MGRRDSLSLWDKDLSAAKRKGAALGTTSLDYETGDKRFWEGHGFSRAA